jgi:hypothetical protein
MGDEPMIMLKVDFCPKCRNYTMITIGETDEGNIDVRPDEEIVNQWITGKTAKILIKKAEKWNSQTAADQEE